MKSAKVTILFIILSFFLVCAFAQEESFEVNIVDDSLRISPIKFLRNENNGFVGLVLKSPLSKNRYFPQKTSYIYTINDIGDTSSICIKKQDTIFFYHDIIKIEADLGGYFLAGRGVALNNEERFTIFTRLDNDLKIIWERVMFFEYDYATFLRVMQLKDEGILCCVTSNPSNSMHLYKMSEYGDSLNYRIYYGDSAGEVYSMTYNYDSTAIWLHNRWAFYQSGASTSSCIEIGENLEQKKVMFYPEYYLPPFNSILYTDGSLLAGGRKLLTHSPTDIESYISVYRLDSSFNILNELSLTNPDTNSRSGDRITVDYYDPSSIYVGGTFNFQNLNGFEDSWFYVTKLNDTLGIEFEKYLGGNDYYTLSSLTAANDGGVLLAGNRSELGAPIFHHNGYIIKLDSLGLITHMFEETKIELKEAIVFPNPGFEKINVRTALKDCDFILYNSRGEQVLNKPINNLVTTFDIKYLKPDIYIYLIVNQNKSIGTGKWIMK